MINTIAGLVLFVFIGGIYLSLSIKKHDEVLKDSEEDR